MSDTDILMFLYVSMLEMKAAMELSPAHQYLCKNCFVNSKIFYGDKLFVDYIYMSRPLAPLARQFSADELLMSFFCQLNYLIQILISE